MPPPPEVRSQWYLTGEQRFRTNWCGKLILQVQWEARVGTARGGGPDWQGTVDRWRDARAEDALANPGPPRTLDMFMC